MKILMLVYNTFENDSRVDRTARTYVEQGHEVTLLALHRKGLPRREKKGGYEVIRCDLKAQPESPDGFFSGIRQRVSKFFSGKRA